MPRLGAQQLLDRRLDRNAAAPLLVGVSGGGDSLALLLIAKAWADRAGRRLAAVTVDHGLQSAGADWARWCADRAAALGVPHRVLTWDGRKPSAGLPAAARAARHALLADEARRIGAAVILLGHTADDRLEAQAMRLAGSTTPSPRDWSPSPAWPQGRGVFVLRPLIAARRAAIRAWLTEAGETWIEDPANDDPSFARARARRALAGEDASPPCPRSAPLRLAAAARDLAGALRLDLAALAAEPARARPVLAAAALSASGATRPPRREALDGLLSRLTAGAPFQATLAGARLVCADSALLIAREAGEYRRRGSPAASLSPGEPVVWDGRYEIEARAADLTVRPLGGLAARLGKAERAALRALPPTVRGALPAIVTAAGAVTCPILAEQGPATARSLVLARFSAACGLIEDEAAIWRVAKTGWAS